jgi:uncharacterized protein (TIGR02302 family)
VTAFQTGSELTPRDVARGRRLIAGSRLALWWEKAWAASWRGLTLLGAGAVLALFDVWTWLPPGPRIVALSALLIAVAALIARDWRAVFWPTRDQGIRRLEDANALPHRPLSSAEDAMAAGKGDPLAEELWRKHLMRQLGAYGRLTPAWPKPNVAFRDPYALRALVLLGLVAGIGVAGPDAFRRIAASFAVEGERAALTAVSALDAWITPPQYTGLAPIIMAQARATVPLDPGRSISVPAGSKLTLRLDSADQPVIERIPLEGGGDATSDEPASDQTGPFGAEIELKLSERVRVFAAGRKVGDWEITVLPDAPPAIAFEGEPQATARLATKVTFTAGDDYGVTKAEAVIRLAPEAQAGDDPTAEDGAGEVAFALPVQSGEGKQIKAAGFEDLTAHPWAGLPVTIQLVATDATGQTGASGEMPFVLPERVFTNPLARAVIEQRRELSRGPGAIPNVAMALEAFTLAPELFDMKAPVYLGLRAAYWRLIKTTKHAGIVEVQAMLWDIALSLQDGGFTMAADEVRRLQKELQAALERNASDEEVAELTAQLRMAMQQMMQSLAEKAPGEMIPMVDAEVLESQDLQAMLDRIEELSRLGAKDAAQELLSQLQNMMEGMSGPIAEPSERERQLARQLSELTEIVREQEKLRDHTFRKDQEFGDFNDAPPQNELARDQGKLKDKLDGVGSEKSAEAQPGEDGQEGEQQAPGRSGQPGKSGKSPSQEDSEIAGNMGEAGKAMNDAAGALREPDTGAALGRQDEALAKLKAAQDAAKQALAAEQKRNGGVRIGRGMGRRNPGMDPAGRPSADGSIDNGSVKIPTERESQRARDILNELRKRSGERERPQPELDYLDRLLRRF